MKNRGFTLIELLVVISIIALLSSVVLASLNVARAKGRDAVRQSDLRTLQQVVEFYHSETGVYPTTGGLWWGNCVGFGGHPTSGSNGYIPNVTPTYISQLPLDPKPTVYGSCYLYNSNGTDYMVLIYGTVEGTVPASLKRPGQPNEQDYAVYTPGASGW